MPATDPSSAPIPAWSWLFALICVAIPVVALGGAIPGALGGGGAAACIAMARKADLSARRRVILCSVTSAACWITYLSIVGLTLSGTSHDAQADTLMRSQELRRQGVPSEPGVDPRRMSVAPPVKKQGADLSLESTRRELYVDAVRLRTKLEDRQERRRQALASGRTTQVLDSMVAHLEKMHASRLEFLVSFHGITSEQLTELIAEGDAAGWPME